MRGLDGKGGVRDGAARPLLLADGGGRALGVGASLHGSSNSLVEHDIAGVGKVGVEVRLETHPNLR